MSLLYAELYERERIKDFLSEAEAARMASLARRTAGPPTTPGSRAPKGLGRLLLLFRRAAV